MSHAIPVPVFTVEWMPAGSFEGDYSAMESVAIVASRSDSDTTLWVIRARYEGDWMIGKLNVKANKASIPFEGKEIFVDNFELGCIKPSIVDWLSGSNGDRPPNGVRGGSIKCSKEVLYVGRGDHNGELIPGTIIPSEHGLFIPVDGAAVKVTDYEVLCRIDPIFKALGHLPELKKNLQD